MAKPWAELITLGPSGEEISGAKILLDMRDMTVGRAPHCSIVIPVPSISGEHCMISFRVSASSKKREPFIIDKSTNGTFLNRKRIEKDKRKLLKTGDVITLVNDLHFRFTSLLDSVDAPSSSSSYVPASSAPKMNFSPSQASPYPPNHATLTTQEISTFLSLQRASLLDSNSKNNNTPNPQSSSSSISSSSSTHSSSSSPSPSSEIGTFATANDALQALMSPDAAVLRRLKQSLLACDAPWLEAFSRLGGLSLLFDLVNELELRASPSADLQALLSLAVSCLKILLNEPLFLALVLAPDRPELASLVSWIGNPLLPARLRAKIMRILAGLAALRQEGHHAAVRAFHAVALQRGERSRFRLLVTSLAMEQEPSFQAGALCLVNALVSSPHEVSLRQHIRDELLALHFDSTLQILARAGHPLLAPQIALFQDSLQRDAALLASPIPASKRASVSISPAAAFATQSQLQLQQSQSQSQQSQSQLQQSQSQSQSQLQLQQSQSQSQSLPLSFSASGIELQRLTCGILDRTEHTPASHATLKKVLLLLQALPSPSTPDGLLAWQRLDQAFSDPSFAQQVAGSPAQEAAARHAQEIAALQAAHRDTLKYQVARHEELLRTTSQRQQSDEFLIAHLQSSLMAAEEKLAAQSLSQLAGPKAAQHAAQQVALKQQQQQAGPSHSSRTPKFVPSAPMQPFLWSKIPPARLRAPSLWLQAPWEQTPLEAAALQEKFRLPFFSPGAPLPSPAQQLASHISAVLGGSCASRTFAMLADMRKDAATLFNEVMSGTLSQLPFSALLTIQELVPVDDDLRLIQEFSQDRNFSLADLPEVEKFWVFASRVNLFSTRIQVLIDFSTIPEEVQESRREVAQVSQCSTEIVGSPVFSGLISLVLAIGNFCNYNPSAPGCSQADAFKLSFLSRLSNIQAVDGTNLFHYIAAYLAKYAPQLLSRVRSDLAHLQPAALVVLKSLNEDSTRYSEKIQELNAFLKDLSLTDQTSAAALSPLLASLSLAVTSFQREIESMNASLQKLSEYLCIPRSDPTFDTLFIIFHEFLAKLNKSLNDHNRQLALTSVDNNNQSIIDPELNTTQKRQNLLTNAYRAAKCGSFLINN